MALAETLNQERAPADRSNNSKATDIVAVLDADTFEQVFAEARPLKAMVFDVSALMEHPLEDGSKIADHRVQQPIEIDLPLLVTGDDYPSIYASIRQLYKDGKLLTVQTRATTYENMVITEIPHEETPDVFDGLTLALRLREARLVKAEYGGLAPAKVKKKAKASTAKRGQQQTTPPPTPAKDKAEKQYKGSTLFRLTRPKGT